MKRWVFLVAVVGAMAMLLAACPGGENLPDRRTVDPLKLLYSETRFAGVGDFGDMTVSTPAGNADVPGWPHMVGKVWNGVAPQVREVVTVHDNANDAADYFVDSDPRRESLDDRREDLVGKSRPYSAPGSPDASQTYCDLLNAASGACDSWMWWARWGQYTVHIQVGGGPGEHDIERRQFEKVVDLAAAHIGGTLGP